MQWQAPLRLGNNTEANQSHRRTYLRFIIDRQEMTSSFKRPMLNSALQLHPTLELVGLSAGREPGAVAYERCCGKSVKRVSMFLWFHGGRSTNLGM